MNYIISSIILLVIIMIIIYILSIDNNMYKLKNKFKEMFSDHMDNKADYSSYIWRMYVLAKWFEKNGVTK